MISPVYIYTFTRTAAKEQWLLGFGSAPVRVLPLSQTRSSADADNRLDAFSGQSRSTNMVPFHMLHIASYCAGVTLSFTIFVFKKFHHL